MKSLRKCDDYNYNYNFNDNHDSVDDENKENISINGNDGLQTSSDLNECKTENNNDNKNLDGIYTNGEKKFDARVCALGKRYIYKIVENKRCTPFESRYVWNLIRIKYGLLDLNLMRKAASYLIGKHDFSAFTVDLHDNNRKSKLKAVNSKNTAVLLDPNKDVINPVKTLSKIEAC